ncbi:hypothetical protein C0993_012489 [Termitomyces sp. T159_Od127]|nr:hypothetical protein C0993_012489 [Termitomyces sp. T159_Od127]
MPRSKFPRRAEQPTTTGLGKQFTSPIKRQDKCKTTTYVQFFGQKQEISRLKAKLEALKKQAEGIIDSPPSLAPLDDKVTMSEPVTSDAAVAFDEDLLPGPECVSTQDEERVSRRTVPNQATKDLYTNWTNLLARLVTPLLEYISKTIGKIPERITSLKAKCKADGSCMTRTNEVLCLFQDYFQKFSVEWCNCEELPHVLVANGLFPTAPLFPRFAISVHLLDFYRALFERSCDAVNAMASALNTFYARRGFVVTDNKGTPVQDAFRRGLGYAAQWYDNLQIRLEQQVDAAVLDADNRIQDSEMMNLSLPMPSHTTSAPLPSDPPTVTSSSTPPKRSQALSQIKLVPAECARILRQRCPCCFGGNLFGRSLEYE